jgi:hypothetical protein
MKEAARPPGVEASGMSDSREVTTTITESYVYDPERVQEVYAALTAMGFKCVNQFANTDDERAQELYEALFDSQLFHELFYGLRDQDSGYDFKEHDPDA